MHAVRRRSACNCWAQTLLAWPTTRPGGRAGAPAVDLNFGCPAPTVNRHRGGAVLLREPELLHAIVRAVRAATPAQVPVTAKMRLGYDDTALARIVPRPLATAGAAEIVVRRTKNRRLSPARSLGLDCPYP